MKQTNRKPLEFKPAKPGKPSAKSQAFEPQHLDFLGFVATGHSIGDAAALVGATRAAYEKWRNRHKGFKAAVEAARESHRRDIACGLHGADAYARMLLDAIQRDESLPAPLRYRASKTILTRKGKADWLPDPIPAESEPLAPYDDEQPESLTDGFVLHPQRTKPESATSASASPQECVSESTNGASASCPQEQSDPASADRRSEPSNLQPRKTAEAPLAQALSAPNLAAEAAQGLPKNPDNPDKPNRTPAAENSIKNQQDPPTPTIPAAASKFFSNPDNHSQAATVPNPHPEAAQASAPKASAAANSTPEAGSRKPEAVRAPASTSTPAAALSQQWLSNHFLHQHESPKAFEKLLANHIRTHQPATAPEELLVFRITQKAWLLRRVETWERVIADSRVAKIREKHPNAAAPACIAMSLLEVKESNQTRFYERTAKLRKEHEDALDRLESKLLTIQQRREAKCLRAELRSLPTVHAPAQGGLPNRYLAQTA